jgi:UDP:flavonoid glycosyltransferase YjiC (YdhE family)
LSDSVAPRDFLFATFAGGGNVPPLLSAARRLLARGHAVRVMSEAAGRDEIAAAGVPFIPYGGGESTVDRLRIGPEMRYGRDIFDAMQQRRPQVCVGSDLLFGSMMAAEAARVPLALFCPHICLLPIEGMLPAGAGLTPARDADARRHHADIARASRDWLDSHLAELNAQRSGLGLPALHTVMQQVASARRILLATSRTFDFAPDELPPVVRYVGPDLGDPPWAGQSWVSPWPAGDARPLVLVAFSSTFQDQAEVIGRVIDALARSGVRGVVTAGPHVEPAAVRLVPDVVVCRAAPHAPILATAAAAITHCGHGTVMKALAAGVPLLCMPMGRDQLDNAVRIVARGAGLLLPADAPPPEIADAVGRLVAEPGFRAAAAGLGAHIRAEARASTLIAELEVLAGARGP